uniref:Uncharacterized protein n=1 Tax=Arthrobacter sp. J3.40 TaxID=347209 RepID=I3W154_9MICC|nr:hypothetical protein [Arthrobacter sp. J3.40]AFK89331.1 hypothetical protein [Arthrobacter sp. J3.40]
MHNLGWREPIFPTEATSSVAGPDYTSIAISAAVSVFIFWAGYSLNSAAARRERQRKVIEDWLRKLTEWVDAYASPSSKPQYTYNSLTNREVIELSLQRKERYLAWWMHEMAVAIILRRKNGSKNFEAREGTSTDLHELLRETGEHLLKWHHKELRSSDFHYPYQLRAEARRKDEDPYEYSRSLGLDAYLKPARMNIVRRWRFFKLLAEPASGTAVFDTLGPFLKRRYVVIALLLVIPKAGINRVRLGKAVATMSVLKWRLARTERRLAEVSRRLEDANTTQPARSLD